MESINEINNNSIEGDYEKNNTSSNIPSTIPCNSAIKHKSELQSSNGHSDQPDINTKYICKKDNCVEVDYYFDFINFPDDSGNIKTYIARTCNPSCITKSNCNETHCISYQCNSNSDCLFDKCVNNICIFNEESSVEYCSNIYEYLLYFEYSYIHCGKFPGDTCKKNKECSSKKCKNGLCEETKTYDMNNIRISKDITSFILVVILFISMILSIIYWICNCCKKRKKKNKFTKI